MVDGDFNVDMSKLEGNTRDKNISAALATPFIEDMGAHFLLRCKLWARYGWTCSML